jgi:integrase/recombinase XerD
MINAQTRKAGINKRIHPHLFRHQILTYITGKNIVDAKIQLISGHKSLSIYQDLSLADVDKEYWEVMEDFPIQ